MNMEKEIKLQIAQLNRWTKLYDEGNPEVDDKTWDKHYFELQKLETETGIYFPDSPTQRINCQVVSGLNKVEHNHWMGSLAKTKDWNEFLNYFVKVNPEKDVIGMLKLDGLSCSLRYLDGKLVSAETRGDGHIGEDILHNALTVKTIPNKISYNEELIVDGEIICTYQDFKSFEKDYKNPRNFAAGSIRLLDAKECEKRKLTFVAWHVVKGLSNSVMSNFYELSKLGFATTPFTSSFDWDAKEFLIKKAEEYGYPIDGLVGRFDDIEFGESLGSTEHHPRSAYAFKMYDEEYDTVLLDIEYGVGRTGLLTPVAVFEPVDADGSIIERASMHNLSVKRETLHGYGWKGQHIKVVKQNAIIPQISWAEENTNDETRYFITEIFHCPVCGEPVEIRDNDGVVTAWCSNSKCDGKLINKLDHFAGKKGMDIKGLSKATLEKLIDWQWVLKTEDIYSLKDYREQWIKKPGFGPKSVDNILTAIEKSKNCSLSKFISSLGIPEIGVKVAKDLGEEFRDYEAFKSAVLNSGFSFAELPNFGTVMNIRLKEFNYEEADRIAELLTFNEPEQDKNIKNTLSNMSIVITGKLALFKNRNELKSIIESCGGKVVGSVSRKTSILINNDKDSKTAKNKAAKENGVTIMSEEEFKNRYLD